MPTIMPEELLTQLKWRYAVKKFDPERSIPADTWRALEEAMVLAPSSYGLQPWRFVVVDDRAMRVKLRGASWNQPQITDAARLVVLARRVNITPDDVGAYVERIMHVRRVGPEPLRALRDMMLGSIADPSSLPGGGMDTYTRSQVYIALGVLLAAAAMLGVDACPMEGFTPAQYDEILGLRQQGYAATVVAALGYRDESDWLAPLPKVRAEHHQVVMHV